VSGPPFFIVGTERSGSNLLRLMLNEHPSLAIPHPPHILKELGPLEARYGDLRDDARFRRLVDDAARLVELHFFPWDVALDRAAAFREAPGRDVYGVKAAFYDQYRRAKGKARWGCKSTFVIHYVENVRRHHPEAQFIHLVRDGRDVAVSAKKSVFNHFHPHYVGKLWAEQQRLAVRWAATLPRERWLTVKYEDLVEDPARTLRGVCGFLKEDYSDALLRYHESGEAKELAGQSRSWKNVDRPVLKTGRAKYKTELTAAEVRAFERQAAPELRHFGYPLEGNPAPAPSRAARAGYWLSETLQSAAETARSLVSDRNAFTQLKKRLFVMKLRLIR
jgi:hypothetical protein